MQRLQLFFLIRTSPLTVASSSARPPFADPRIDSMTAHVTVVERDRVIAGQIPAHSRHRDVGIELHRHQERHVAAHTPKFEIAVPRELIDSHLDVAAHGIRRDRAGVQAIQVNVSAHAICLHVALCTADRDVAAH